MKTRFLHCLVLASPLIAGSAHAGTELGNGVENYHEENIHAWFTGNRVVKYCYMIGENFGVSESDIKREIPAVAETWGSYLKNRNVISDGEKRVPISDGTTYVERGPSTRFELQSCDGREDLKIYFGADDAQTAPFKTRSSDALAFAQMTNFDDALGWGKGFVWIAPPGHISAGYPDWNVPNVLHGILLHEFGHVFGGRHQEYTIMDSTLGWYIRYAAEHSDVMKFYLTEIDHLQEFIGRGTKQSFSYEGTRASMPATPEYPSVQLLSSGFKLLMGRDPVGMVRSKAYGTDGLGKAAGGPGAEIRFSYEDDLERKEFVVRFKNLLSWWEQYGLLSLPSYSEDSAGNRTFERTPFSSTRYSYFGRVVDAKGTELTVIVNRNSSYYAEDGDNPILAPMNPLSIILQGEEHNRLLFAAGVGEFR